jgi:hypothetical protein
MQFTVIERIISHYNHESPKVIVNKFFCLCACFFLLVSMHCKGQLVRAYRDSRYYLNDLKSDIETFMKPITFKVQKIF